jgi:hypothetical protein
MNDQQTKDLKRAVKLLENPSFGAKLADIVGTPIEKAIALLPNKAQEAIGKATQKAILAALKIATKTMDRHDPESGEAVPESSDWWHMGTVAATGAAGGFFGAWGLVVEVPVTTTIMMRSIADIARSENADLSDVDVQLECVKVLAMGGRSSSDDASDVGYFVAREALARATAEAAAHIAKNGIDKEGAPALVRLILAIAERYSINISEKAAAQAVPVIGAAGGAIINTVFMDHFQDMARGHFTVLRLEKALGADTVKAKYLELRKAAA